MKKVLFATTALVATAGMAAADVTVSGTGRLGIVYNNQKVFGASAAQSKTRIEKRMTINIDGSGSTETGIDFGGRIRIRSDENVGSAVAGANVWIGNDMFRVTVGNTDGAALNRMNYFAGTASLTGLHWANVPFNIGNSRFDLNTYSSRGTAGGANSDVVRLDFNVGGFGVSLSVDNAGRFNPNTTPAGGGRESAIAASYNFGDWTVAAAYIDNFNNAAGTVANPKLDAWSIGIFGSIGDFGVNLAHTDKERIGSKTVLSGSYNFGDTTVNAFIARTSEDNDAGNSAGILPTGSETEFGIGFEHSLGGATLAGGISRNYQKNTMADLGIRFSF